MNDYLVSFLFYLVPANVLAITIILLGRRKDVYFSFIEYLLIYLPWAGFIALTLVIFGGLDKVPSLPVIKVFLIVLQSIGAGVMGGAILMPRLVMRDSKMRPLGITAISATLITVLYVKFRMMLFIMVEGLSAAIT
ncbi:hypothetical protein Ga0123462_0715 [Mariprofundus ferrinatatus]|uniref:Uncharacterized protein n=1 Tax=Mariprofundus ferrinatatus TaxID=1921087 RepID=A0A2K8L2N2_9PROT|nr:hypothetical protein [Mariprofundus ferrinatatus]ATX81585.1 hypothetical protein Ga0123462_0715 [Mariprofundus ferrinatatus]